MISKVSKKYKRLCKILQMSFCRRQAKQINNQLFSEYLCLVLLRAELEVYKAIKSWAEIKLYTIINKDLSAV